MPDPIHPENAPDAVNAVLKKYSRNKFEDVQTELTKHPMAKRLIKRHKHAWEEGDEYSWDTMVTSNSPATTTSLFKRISVDTGPLIQNQKVPIKFYMTHFMYDTREKMFAQGFSKVHDVVNLRKYDATKSLVVLIEETGWAAPSDQTTPDELEKAYGLSAWIKAATAIGDGDFTAAGDNSAFSSGTAGLSRTDYPGLIPWTFGYASTADSDLVTKMRRANYEVDFQAPVKHPSFGVDTNYGYYTTYDNCVDFENQLKAQNQMLGMSIDPTSGKAMFASRMIEPVPWLDKNASRSTTHTHLGLEPMIGINWTKFMPVFSKKMYMKWGKTMDVPMTPFTKYKCQDTAIQFVCVNPREALWMGNKL